MDNYGPEHGDLSDLEKFGNDHENPIVPSRRPLAFRVVAVALLVVLVAGLAAAFNAQLNFRTPESTADPGQLTEQTWPLPPSTPPVLLVDFTDEWGLADRVGAASGDPMAGGVAIIDLDHDGDLDLIIAHDTVDVMIWDDGKYQIALTLPVRDAMAVTASDLDRDGWPDLLIARDAPKDLIVWGGAWIPQRGDPEEITELEGSAPSSGLLAGELSGDDRIDIVSLGRGRARGAQDLLWVASADLPRRFIDTPLSEDPRLSLAGEIVDADGDGLSDIWITRDVGWDAGGDSVFSRLGDPEGPWFDIANDLQADLAADSMGITIADLDADGQLDAYVSDLGDNEVLLRSGDVYSKAAASGAARIRPPGSPEEMVSSSWASGAVDINLDGHLDLVVANGGFANGGMRNKIPGTTVAITDPPAILLGLGDGRFVDVWSDLGLDWDSASRGMTIGDVDGDGDHDLIFVSADGQVRALRNESARASITVIPDRVCDSAGATVRVLRSDQARFEKLLAANTFAGAHQAGAIVGTNNESVDITIVWATRPQSVVTVSGSTQRQQVLVSCEGVEP